MEKQVLANTMNARISSPSGWKTVANTISQLVDEATFNVDQDGITFRGMDPAHVAMIDLFWPSMSFDKFSCEKKQSFTVRMEDFTKIVKRASAEDSFEISHEKKDVLQFNIGSGREFTLHLMDSTTGESPLPKLNFDASYALNLSAVERILSDALTVSDHIRIAASKDGIEFSARGDAGDFKQSIKSGSLDLIELKCSNDATATYSLEYITKIIKSAKESNESVAFFMASKMPLKIEFKLTPEANSKGYIRFFLAPRVQE